MNRKIARWLVCVVVGTALLRCPALLAAAPANSVPDAATWAAAEREACGQNLKVIYSAIETYQTDHRALPNWLSDLVPQYLADTNVLICPVCRRTGEAESPPLADPKLPSSYLFEFCPVPLGGAVTNAAGRTRRDWKRLQMGLVGSIVPLVRCRHHSPVLNLAFDGRLYDSPSLWETLVTNRVSLADLSAARLFADNPAPPPKSPAKAAARRFPPRDRKAGKELLDLSGFYNAGLRESWHGRAGNDLAALPTGLQTFGGVQFDVRGIVQLGSKSDSVGKYPSQVKGIKVRQKCGYVHFLQAAAFGSATDNGKAIGTYVVHFATQNMRLEVPIIYGRDVRNWHTLPGEPAPGGGLRVGWMGENAVSRKSGSSLRLFVTTWTNLAPEVEIESIDYVSGMGLAAPFLLAVTLDSLPARPAVGSSLPENARPAQDSNSAVEARPATNAALPLRTAERESGTHLAVASRPHPAALRPQLFVWLGAAVLVTAVLVWAIRRRTLAAAQSPLLLPAGSSGSGASSYTVVPQQSVTASVSEAPEPLSQPQPVIHLPKEGATQTRSEAGASRIPPAAVSGQPRDTRIHSALVMHLGQWLKQKLLRRLIADRAGLMETQEVATLKLKTVEERVARIEGLLQEQIRAYEQRIEELNRELLAAREENRELLRARIAQVRAEMEAARARLMALGKDEG